MRDNAGNVPPMPAIYPDGVAPVVRNADKGTELIKMRWGFPKPAIFTADVRNIERLFGMEPGKLRAR